MCLSAQHLSLNRVVRCLLGFVHVDGGLQGLMRKQSWKPNIIQTYYPVVLEERHEAVVRRTIERSQKPKQRQNRWSWGGALHNRINNTGKEGGLLCLPASLPQDSTGIHFSSSERKDDSVRVSLNSLLLVLLLLAVACLWPSCVAKR